MSTIDKAIKLQLFVERYKTSTAKSFMGLIKELEREANALLLSTDLLALSPPQLVKALTIVKQRVKLKGSSLLNDYSIELHDFVTFIVGIESSAWGAKNVPTTLPRQVFLVPLGIDTSDRGKLVEAFVYSKWDMMVDRVFGTIHRGVFEKRPNHQLLDDIRGTAAVRYQDGLISSLRKYAVVINSTVVQHLFSATRNEVLKFTDAKGILWNSLLERITCARCRGLDTMPFSLKKGPRSPLHMGCRCIMVPIFDDTRINVAKDGYYSWLKNQSKQLIIDVLGPTRAAVFIEGGLSAERFSALQLDKKFEAITLDEFRKLAPSAFARAGV